MSTVPMSEPDGLAGSPAEIIQFCTSCFAASNGLDIDNIWRMNRENALDALVIDNSPDRKSFVNAPAPAGNYRAGKYLFADFVAFLDKTMDINKIAYFEVR